MIELEKLFGKSKQTILQELAKGEKSALQIAKKTGQSIANTVQQLQLLEAHNIITKTKPEKEKRP